ncbi:MAG: hypothetical protein NC918_02355 [Candidatus Omnitrophica bacterium]|nr:hypothetical protein [Candidatus Omnitrophota bacterium]
MKFLLRLTTISFLFLSFLYGKTLSSNWKELSSEHFIVYYVGDDKFIKDVLSAAEKYYQHIALDIGYPRYSEFWTWEKRAKIYIYPTKNDFLKATSQPEWSEGIANYANKSIISYAWSKGFIESLLPHEIAHLIFRDFVGFKGEIPLWLDEGVAQWAEVVKRQHIKELVKKLFLEDSLLSLSDLTKLDIRNLKDKNRVYIRPTRTKDGSPGVLFISLEQLINNYYLQSASVVGFLIEKYGSSDFAAFCRELRDGKNLDDAIRAVYGIHFKNIEELETVWRKYISEN